MMIPVVVESVRVNQANGARVVILKDEKLDRYLLIWVGHSEANTIAMELQGEKPPRPLTADLTKSIIDALGASIVDVSITDLANDVYYATIGLVNAGGDRLDIDSRPSDAIALAIRYDAPIFADEDILDSSSITMRQERDDRLDVYRDFVNQLFEQSQDFGEGERRPDA
jgi:bifunctional DNase/RNase